MDRFGGSGRPAFNNYYDQQQYEQPATQNTQDPNLAQTADSSSYGQSQNVGYGYNSNEPEQYQTQDYQAEEGQVSLSDYNSHESCIRISTKK
jgi:hypothetical protein